MERHTSAGLLGPAPKMALLAMVLALMASLLTIPATAEDVVAAKLDREPPAADAGKGYRLGVFPFLPPLSLDRVFAPIVKDLGSGIQSQVHLRTKLDFEQFHNELASGSYDLAFLHPFFYVEAADKYGYVPLARLESPLRVILLSKANSPMTDFADLKGKTLALPPKLAAVSKLMDVELLDAGLKPGEDVQIHHFASKMSCLHAVTVGDADACGLPEFVLAHLSAKQLSMLRVVWTSRSIPAVVFAAHSRMSEETRNKLRERIVSWTETDVGREILSSYKWSGYVNAEDQDYDEVRRYDLMLRVSSTK